MATPPPADRTVLIKAGPGSPPLPKSFVDQKWPFGVDPYRRCDGAKEGCVAWLQDLDGAPGDEVMLLVADTVLVYKQGPSGWAQAGTMTPYVCEGVSDAMRVGNFQLVAPVATWRDIEVAGRRLRMMEEGRYDCGPKPTPSKDGSSHFVFKK